VIPHTLPLIMVQLVIKAALAMLIDGGLSYLGLGVAPPTPTWGRMLYEGQHRTDSQRDSGQENQAGATGKVGRPPAPSPAERRGKAS
jgi:hypothetical protein